MQKELKLKMKAEERKKKREEQEKLKMEEEMRKLEELTRPCLLYTSPSPRDRQKSRMPSSA